MRVLVTYIYFLFLVQGLFAQQTTTINGREFIIHTVKPKETLYGISKQYNVNQDTIIAYNPNVKGGLKIDETLRFPSGKGMIENPINGQINDVKTIKHLVKQGETIYSLTKKYNLTTEELISFNPDLKNGLKADVTLTIPVKQGYTSSENNQDRIQPILQNSTFCDTVINRDKNLKIALLLPFSTNRGINTKIAVEFYGGFRVALDSMINEGLNITLYVYDTKSKSDSDQVMDILTKPEFEEIDMIVGPLYTANLQQVADFGNRRKIPVISPFARSVSILNNNYCVVKLTPSEETVSKKSLQYFNSFYPDANYIFIDPGSKKDSAVSSYYYSALKNLNIKDTSRMHFTSLKSGGAVSKLKKDTKNIIVFPCTKEITVKDYLTKLNKAVLDKYDISLLGMEEWLEFNNVEAGYYNNLNLHIPTVNFFSYTDSTNFQFISSYQKLLKTDPTFYSFRGYQVACYIVNAWKKFGYALGDCLKRKIECTCPEPYKFVRPDSYSGYENVTIDMMIFENMKYRIFPYFY